jgi:hypothetical protein
MPDGHSLRLSMIMASPKPKCADNGLLLTESSLRKDTIVHPSPLFETEVFLGAVKGSLPRLPEELRNPGDHKGWSPCRKT